MKIQTHFLVAALLTTALSACNEQPTGPTTQPTAVPTAAPTAQATVRPMAQPTSAPSSGESALPSTAPSTGASSAPSSSPNPAASTPASATPTPVASASASVNTNVPAPLNFRTTDRTSSTLYTSWTFPSVDQPSAFNLYLNGQQVAQGVTANIYTFAGLNASTEYNLKIETVSGGGLSEAVTLNVSTLAAGTTTSGGGAGGSSGSTGGSTNTGNTTVALTQVERLARPAINEGLIRQEQNTLLNTWNMVPPSADLSAVQAAVDLRTEAVTVLSAIQSQVQAALGYDNSPGKPVRTTQQQTDRVNAIAGSFLPDVMRIDTTGESGYAMGITDLSQPRPFRGRRLDDDVIDITLGVLVPGGTLDPLDPGRPVIEGAETDSVEYDDMFMGNRIHDPIQLSFPYLPAPN